MWKFGFVFLKRTQNAVFVVVFSNAHKKNLSKFPDCCQEAFFYCLRYPEDVYISGLLSSLKSHRIWVAPWLIGVQLNSASSLKYAHSFFAACLLINHNSNQTSWSHLFTNNSSDLVLRKETKNSSSAFSVAAPTLCYSLLVTIRRSTAITTLRKKI